MHLSLFSATVAGLLALVSYGAPLPKVSPDQMTAEAALNAFQSLSPLAVLAPPTILHSNSRLYKRSPIADPLPSPAPKSVGAKIKAGFEKAGKAIKKGFQKAGEGIIKAAKKVAPVLKKIGHVATGVMSKVVSTVGKVAGKVVPGLGKVIQAGTTAVSQGWQSASDALGSGPGSAKQKVVNGLKKKWAGPQAIANVI